MSCDSSTGKNPVCKYAYQHSNQVRISWSDPVYKMFWSSDSSFGSCALIMESGPDQSNDWL